MPSLHVGEVISWRGGIDFSSCSDVMAVMACITDFSDVSVSFPANVPPVKVVSPGSIVSCSSRGSLGDMTSVVLVLVVSREAACAV